MQVNIINKLLRENGSAVPEAVTEHLKKIKETIYTDLVEVSGKFQNQISQLVAKQPNIEENTKLLERISKAAGYFSEKVKAIVVTDFARADLEVDNRTLRKQLKNSSEKLNEEATIKLASFEICKAEFNVKKLLDERAKTIVAKNQPATKTKKAKEIVNFEDIPHPNLYNTLRQWRFEKATEIEKPAYIVFSQKTLYELVNYLPVETATLKLINGFGDRKIEQFGADILEIIQNYCAENNIQRMEIPLKEVKEKKPKIDTKKVTLELYNAGKTVAEIAAERELTTGTIENHLAHYVGLGELDVKLFLTDEKLKLITDHFKTTDNKSFGEAKAQLGDNVSYSELRMGLSYLESLQI
jgi:hypothetical protein